MSSIVRVGVVALCISVVGCGRRDDPLPPDAKGPQTSMVQLTSDGIEFERNEKQRAALIDRIVTKVRPQTASEDAQQAKVGF
jgi:hypothetical protein